MTRSMQSVRKKFGDLLPTDADGSVGISIKAAARKSLDMVGSALGTSSPTTSSKVFNFNINISVSGDIGTKSNLESTAEELSRQIYNNVKRKLEAFA